jgi:hypothetical protein
MFLCELCGAESPNPDDFTVVGCNKVCDNCLATARQLEKSDHLLLHSDAVRDEIAVEEAAEKGKNDIL